MDTQGCMDAGRFDVGVGGSGLIVEGFGGGRSEAVGRAA